MELLSIYILSMSAPQIALLRRLFQMNKAEQTEELRCQQRWKCGLKSWIGEMMDGVLKMKDTIYDKTILIGRENYR